MGLLTDAFDSYRPLPVQGQPKRTPLPSGIRADHPLAGELRAAIEREACFRSRVEVHGFADEAPKLAEAVAARANLEARIRADEMP